MANDAYFIANTIRAQEQVQAALSLLYPDANALKIIPPHRRGVPYTNMVNWQAVAEFLTAQVGDIEVHYTGTTVDTEAVKQADAGEIDLLSLNRLELMEVAKERGIEVEGTGMSGYIRRDDVLKALGITDEPEDNDEPEDSESGENDEPELTEKGELEDVNDDDDSIESGEAVSS